ncbi:MAG: phospho-N-acetylmuramoyl-pentapeptide-transferase [Oscillospiraceae bacterium]|jgi:phospho-N-acetylmuramoyl-pentapeptide-transferase|nr:phospho-N-acetylmuramoyl-pentapeptide-transferase [Oscillospiraceae bacterium]
MNGYAAMIIAALAALGITALLGYALIPWLHKLKFGQIILDIGPSWHKHKQGTPTMGGLMFIPGVLLSCGAVFLTDWLLGGKLLRPDAFFAQGFATKLGTGLLMAALFGLMGFLDDYIKVVKKRNKGLSISQKTIMQLLISLGYLSSLWLSMEKAPYTFIPFVGQVQLRWFFWIFAFVVVYASTNAVNFTDGVDGLCSGVTLVAGVGFAVFAVMRGMFGAGVVAAAMAGGCAGFLIWNHNPAKVIMGDTGALFLGGLVVAISFTLDCPVILLLMGLIYVIEGLSDVIQIGYFKLTHGKRIFKMAPIHHHFEMSGWNEKKIGLVFSLVQLLGVAAAIALLYFGLPILVRVADSGAVVQ